MALMFDYAVPSVDNVYEVKEKKYPRSELDKNGSVIVSFADFTWSGLTATSTSSLWNSTGMGTWSPPMAKKFTPKKCKRKGWRD